MTSSPARGILGSLLLLTTLLAAPAAAQDLDKEGQRPAEGAANQAAAVQAAEQAREALPADAEPTFAQVLADPDNVELNARYAQAQIRRGDLKGAAATLERLLLLAPKRHELRVLYAAVLYRLDSLGEAQREFETLRKLDLPAGLRADVEDYLRRIESRRKRTHLTGRVGAGFELDQNRNAAPSSGKRLLSGTETILTSDSRRKEDASSILLGNLELRRELGGQSGHEAFGGVTYYRAEQTHTRSLNLEAYSLQGGASLKAPRMSATPTLLFDYVLLAEHKYLRNMGFSLRGDRKFGRSTLAYAELRHVYQDYTVTPGIPNAVDRTGAQVDLTLGAERVVAPTLKLGGSLSSSLKNAGRAYLGFHRTALGGNALRLVGKGRFLLAATTLGFDRYRDSDTAVSRTRRKDLNLRAGLTFGTPLAFIDPSLKELLWTTTLEYYHSWSNIQNYAYTDAKLAGMLTYRWDWGF
ncbi:MAG: tetratricopeptide repeat protein [Elusimicrobiota bacterium]|jgi:tetratricopeptide (TPR) repeat protein